MLPGAGRILVAVWEISSAWTHLAALFLQFVLGLCPGRWHHLSATPSTPRNEAFHACADTCCHCQVKPRIQPCLHRRSLLGRERKVERVWSKAWKMLWRCDEFIERCTSSCYHIMLRNVGDGW